MTMLDRLEALLRDASPLPWRQTMHPTGQPPMPQAVWRGEGESVYADACGFFCERERDMVLAAVNALPALLRVARAAKDWSKCAARGGCNGCLRGIDAALADLAKEET